jgi:hypothetical protein
MRSSKAIHKRVSGYFLSEEIVNYFELKKCSESLLCIAFELRNRILTAKSGFNIVMLYECNAIAKMRFIKIAYIPVVNKLKII